jgi:hypothetical protein
MIAGNAPARVLGTPARCAAQIPPGRGAAQPAEPG